METGAGLGGVGVWGGHLRPPGHGWGAGGQGDTGTPRGDPAAPALLALGPHPPPTPGAPRCARLRLGGDPAAGRGRGRGWGGPPLGGCSLGAAPSRNQTRPCPEGLPIRALISANDRARLPAPASLWGGGLWAGPDPAAAAGAERLGAALRGQLQPPRPPARSGTFECVCRARGHAHGRACAHTHGRARGNAVVHSPVEAPTCTNPAVRSGCRSRDGRGDTAGTPCGCPVLPVLVAWLCQGQALLWGSPAASPWVWGEMKASPHLPLQGGGNPGACCAWRGCNAAPLGSAWPGTAASLRPPIPPSSHPSVPPSPWLCEHIRPSVPPSVPLSLHPRAVPRVGTALGSPPPFKGPEEGAWCCPVPTAALKATN